MNQGLAFRSPQPDNYAKVEPRLQLLVEAEPGYRIFFQNFFDLILHRVEPPLFLASLPVHHRRHFYVRTGIHWTVVLESIVWHLAAVPLLLVLWTLSLKWESQRYPLEQPTVTQSQQITYYPPAESFPAREGRQSVEATPARTATSSQPAIHVASEQRRSGMEAPNVTISGGARFEIASPHSALPSVPLSATARSQLVLPADLSEVIGPAPDTTELSLRNLAAPAASVVAPPPQVAGLRRRGGISVPVTVVAPMPAMQGSVRTRKGGSIDTAASAVAPPPPQLPKTGQHAGRGMGNGAFTASGTTVVPPAPSVERGLILAGGRGDSLARTGTLAVPPAPSIRDRIFLPSGGGSSGNGVGVQRVVPPSPSIGRALILGGGGGNSLGGAGVQVAPPAPSIGGAGVFGGSRLTKSFAGAGGSAVPPVPSVGQIPFHGGKGGNGAGVLTSSEMQVVAPAPSLAGSGLGRGGTRRGNGENSLAASVGPQAIPPSGMGSGGQGSGTGGGNTPSATGSQDLPGSAQSAGGSGGGNSSGPSSAGTETVAGLTAPVSGAVVRGGQGAAPIISSAIPSHAEMADIPAGKTQVLPLRVIQLALALPMTSYFSNYEAFVAERSVNHDTTQLIKLVYTFLPYQRRLTEFGVNTSKTFNLRVTRDPACDESLLSMTWPEGEGQGQPSSAESNKNKLPCYRTTADDYRKAWEKAR